MVGLLAGVAAQDVAAVLGPERPRELELDEAELDPGGARRGAPDPVQRVGFGGRQSPWCAVLPGVTTGTEYFDGFTGTTGLSSVLSRSMSLFH